MDRTLPDEVRMLVRDVDPATADVDRDATRIHERGMTRGRLEAMRWLLRTYDAEELRAHLVRVGPSGMPAREFAFGSAVLDVPPPPTDACRGGGRPAWAD